MLQVHQLRKSFGDHLAVDGLSLQLQAGEIYGFLGPNGAGKTTTLAMIAGLLQADAGEILLLNGLRPTDPAARLHFGYAPQALALYDNLSARENLAFFGSLTGLSATALKRAMQQALEITALEDRADDRVAHYSGGMKRRLNLAVAILHQPDILLLDEPTVGVDPQSRNLLLEAIGRLRDQGHAIVYTTHYMEEVERLADRIGIMDHGRLLAEGSLQQLLQEHGGGYRLRWRENGELREQTCEDPVTWLQSHAIRPDPASLHIHPPDLEQVFLRLTGKHLRD